jgi:acyl-CoA synthetase (AMP-forming)/AMP-acid ligase II
MSFWERMIENPYADNPVWEWDGVEFRESTWRATVAAAEVVASNLRARGVTPGAVVPAVLTNGPDVSPGILGIWLAGATIASLPIIARGMSVERYMAQLTRLCRTLDATWLLAEERFLALMPPELRLGVDVVGYASLLSGCPGPIEPPPLDQTIFIQFSSGTTGEPRGVELSGLAIEAQLRMLARHLAIDPERDVGYMWLPQSHDMGFFGCTLLARYCGTRGIKSTPERFLESPRNWFEDCSRFRATMTAGPPSAIALATRAERIRSSGESLDDLRLCLVGAETISWSVLSAAAETFAHRGLRLEAFTPAYGLAEATLAVTVDRVEAPPRYIDVDAGHLRGASAGSTATRRLVSSGTPLQSTTVRIDADSGEVLVSSPSAAGGYRGAAATRTRRRGNDEIWTGDLGLMRDGHLYLYGRTDDLIIVGGRNVYVHDVEAALGSDPGVRDGSCALVCAGEDSPRVGAVVEPASSELDREALALRMSEITLEAAGLSLDEVVFLPRGAFPKTPSGKAQRYRCREILSHPGTGARVQLRRHPTGIGS